MTPEFIKKLQTETLYLWDDIDELMVKSVPQGGYFIKQIGGQEVPSSFESEVVFRAVHSEKEITRAEYDR